MSRGNTSQGKSSSTSLGPCYDCNKAVINRVCREPNSIDWVFGHWILGAG